MGGIRAYIARRRRTGSVIFFLLVILSAWGKEPECFLYIEKRAFLPGEEIQVQIMVPETTPSKLKITEPELPPEVSIIKGPYINPTAQKKSLIRYYFSSSIPGRYFIERFSFSNQKKTFYTLPFIIEIAGKNPKKAAFSSAVSAIPDKKIFPGQIVPLRFMIPNLKSEHYKIFSETTGGDKGIVLESGTKGNHKYVKKETASYSVTDIICCDNLFVPTSEGKTLLPDIIIKCAGEKEIFEQRITGKTIKTEKFPDKISDSRAVGSFKFTASAEQKENIVTIKAILEGTGNFPVIRTPELIADPEEISAVKRETYSIQPDGSWFTGKKETIWTLAAKETIKKTAVVIPGWRAMTGSGKYYLFPEKKFEFEFEGTAPAKKAEKEKTVNFTFTPALILFLLSAGSFITLFLMKKRKTAFAVLLIISALIFIISLRPGSEYGTVIQNGAELRKIPDPEGTLLKSFSSGEKIIISGESGNYFLITDENREKGWVEKRLVKITEKKNLKK